MGSSSLGGSGRRRIISEINVTPLVDIMLVLLIVFMVTATYLVRDAITVKLPEAATGEPRKVSLIAIVLDKDGKLAMNGRIVDEQQIRSYIRERRGEGEPLEAVIAADRRTRHGEVVRLIDLVRGEGVTKFAINVIKE